MLCRERTMQGFDDRLSVYAEQSVFLLLMPTFAHVGI